MTCRILFDPAEHPGAPWVPQFRLLFWWIAFGILTTDGMDSEDVSCASMDEAVKVIEERGFRVHHVRMKGRLAAA